MKYVLLTGGAGGLGEICARALAANGFMVFAADINEEALAEIGKTENIIPLKVDITDQASIDEAKRMVKEHTDTLHAVINFAGIHTLCSMIEGACSETIERMLRVNVMGMVRINRTFIDLVMAGGDVSKSNLSFGNTAEYLAKFSSSKEKPYNLSYSTVTNSDVAGANPNADLVCISFPGTPMFAANSYLVIKDKDMKYLYEVDGDELIELETTTQDGYLAYRTDRLTSYIASDRPLKNAVSSSDKETSSSSSSSSTSSSTTSGGSTSSKPNPDTGR